MADLDKAAQTGSNASAQTDATPKGGAKYKCVTKCYWKGQLYNEGDTVTVPSGTKVPAHFTKA